MDDRQKNEIAVFRYGIISPVLHSTRTDQKGYFKEMAAKVFDVPHVGRHGYKWTTFKHWLKVYRKTGIDGLVPAQRNDRGVSRRISPELGGMIKSVKEEYPYLSCANLYRLLIEQERLPYPPISDGTLRKFLKDHGLDKQEKEPTPRKKYEAPFVNDLWVADFMHGPGNLFGKKKKVYFMAIIDDHSRMIVGGRFFLHENTLSLEEVFKKAALTYGLPKKFYCDNGAAFSSHHLKWACAKLGVALIHSKPYRYMEGVKEIKLKIISAAELDLCFYQTIKRKVKKDSTISLKTILYEVPHRYVGSYVELRFPTSRPSELTIYEDGKAVYAVKPVDVHKNSEKPLGLRFSEGQKEGKE